MKKHSLKTYRCKRCGNVSSIDTNHTDDVYSIGHFNTCNSCPPWAKYPEFGSVTVWEYVSK